MVVSVKEYKNGVQVAADSVEGIAKFDIMSENCPNFLDYVYEYWGGKCFASEIERIANDFVEDMDEDLGNLFEAGAPEYILMQPVMNFIDAKALVSRLF